MKTLFKHYIPSTNNYNSSTMLSRLCFRTLRTFASFKLPSDYDISFMKGLIQAKTTSTLTLGQKLSSISPGNMYRVLDEFSRDALFSLAHDYQLGIPLSIVTISLILRFAFFYPNIKGQIGALKMQGIKGEMDKYKEKVKIAQMSRNMVMMKEAQNEFAETRKRHGIDNFYALINLVQMPFIITWFLSLRYVTAMPEIYPEIQQQGFLWIEDLSVYDPYFILPVTAACISSLSIVISPTIKNSAVANPLMAPIARYMKFLPFIALPFTSLFPAALNIYWLTFAVSQLTLMGIINSKYIKKKYELIQEKPVPKIVQAVFVEDKNRNPAQNSGEKFESEKAQTIQVLSHRPKKKKKAD